MTMQVISCNRVLPDGRVCGAPSLVHGIQYFYRAIGMAESGMVERTLTETRYEIECPSCGRRAQTETCDR